MSIFDQVYIYTSLYVTRHFYSHNVCHYTLCLVRSEIQISPPENKYGKGKLFSILKLLGTRILFLKLKKYYMR